MPVSVEGKKPGLWKLGYIFIGLVCVVFGGSGVAMFFKMNESEKTWAEGVNRLEKAGEKSPEHRFVTEHYIACRSELKVPTKDECIAQLLTIAAAKGPEFKSKVDVAIIDLGLIK